MECLTTIQEIMYNEILNVVQDRTNSIKLSIDISCSKLIDDEYKHRMTLELST